MAAVGHVPAIYCWRANEIPEPDLERDHLDSISPNGVSIIQEAMSRLLNDLAGEFRVANDSGFSEYSPTSELDQIDHEIRQLRSVMLAFKHEFGRRVSLMSKRRNSNIPFGKLPIELVGSILTQTITTNPHYPKYSENSPPYATIWDIRKLAKVSVGWWHAIESTPAVWTDIGLEPKREVALKLRKSGSLPLNIVSMGHPVDLLAGHSNRWKCVFLNLMRMHDTEPALRHLRVQLPCLESLTFLCTPQQGARSRLQLKEASMLRHLHLEGILPDPQMSALTTVRHLTLVNVNDIRIKDLVAIVSHTPNLESLVITGVESQADEAEDEPTAPFNPVEVPMLKRLILDQPAPSICLQLLAGLHAEHLSYLSVERAESDAEDATGIFHQLIRPNGLVHGSILSTVIINSSTEIIDMVIKDDIALTMTGFGFNKDTTFHISLSYLNWGWLASPGNFSTFAASLPAVDLTITGVASHHRSNTDSPWSLTCFHSMFSITSITINSEGDFATRLFRDVLADECTIEEQRAWTFPSLTGICIGRDAQDHDWMSWIHSTLKRRAEVIRDPPLSEISVWYEDDDRCWVGPIV